MHHEHFAMLHLNASEEQGALWLVVWTGLKTAPPPSFGGIPREQRAPINPQNILTFSAVYTVLNAGDSPPIRQYRRNKGSVVVIHASFVKAVTLRATRLSDKESFAAV